MKKLIGTLILAGSSLFAGPRVGVGVGVGVPVAPPVVAYAAPAPGPGFVFVNGYWRPRYAVRGYYAPRFYGGRSSGRWHR